MIADVGAGTKREAFDHARMAAALSAATGTKLDAGHLVVTALDMVGDAPRMTIAGKVYDWDSAVTRCVEHPEPVHKSDHACSPGDTYALFLHGDDLWLEEAATGATRALSHDGATDRAYAAVAGVGAKLHRAKLGVVTPPLGEFSPDGRYFLTFQNDERAAPLTTLLETVPPGGGRPVLLLPRILRGGSADERAALYLRSADRSAGAG